MIAPKIVDARIEPKFAVTGFGNACSSNRAFSKDHAPLLEKAYARISEISGVPVNAVVPLTLVVDLKELSCRHRGQKVLNNLRMAIVEHVEMLEDSVYAESRERLSAGVAFHYAARRLNEIARGTLGGSYNYGLAGGMHTVFVLAGLDEKKDADREAADSVAQMMNGHFTAINCLVNWSFRETEPTPHEIEARAIVGRVLDSSSNLRDIEAGLANGETFDPELIYLEEVGMGPLRRLREFMHGNGGGNLVAILNSLTILAHYERARIEEFMNSRKRAIEWRDESHGLPLKSVQDVLAEHGILTNGRLTEKAHDLVADDVHGFFMAD